MTSTAYLQVGTDWFQGRIDQVTELQREKHLTYEHCIVICPYSVVKGHVQPMKCRFKNIAIFKPPLTTDDQSLDSDYKPRGRRPLQT